MIVHDSRALYDPIPKHYLVDQISMWAVKPQTPNEH